MPRASEESSRLAIAAPVWAGIPSHLGKAVLMLRHPRFDHPPPGMLQQILSLSPSCWRAFLKYEAPHSMKSFFRLCLSAFAKTAPASAIVSCASAQTVRLLPEAAASLHRPSRTDNRNQRCISSICRIFSWPDGQLFSSTDGTRSVRHCSAKLYCLSTHIVSVPIVFGPAIDMSDHKVTDMRILLMMAVLPAAFLMAYV